MDNEIAERIAMALEGIEKELERQAVTAEKALESNLEWIAEQRERQAKAEEAQRKFAAQIGLGIGQPGIRG